MSKEGMNVALVPLERIQSVILLIRTQKVILDSDLARLYGVSTKVLNQAVHRNPGRFPPDFVFPLIASEWIALRSQSVTSSSWGGRRSLPAAFTEHGAIMAATVLNSEQAVKVSVYVVRAFIKVRELLANHQQLAGKLDELERRLQKHDGQILALIDAIRQLMTDPEPSRKPPIGYLTEAGMKKSKRK